ncbi:MAG: hypothetical protein VBE63_13135 [Lamprobacter sp.]|uniref:hypothetical protein n=1 Tax=Lamprobacter sp. TaxID=3100796 RepID=UPI002B260710|nr:hypothetical protein [Lamprobacter sp.]MEA3640873.1 hypothetical protein [Lamprobacter sp.]
MTISGEASATGNRQALIEDCIDGLEVYAIRARTLIDKAISLGREGKTMSIWPLPWPWYFRSKAPT